MRRSPTPIRDEKDFIHKNKRSKEYHSTFWAILFYINLIATVYMFYNLINETIGIENFIGMIFSKYQDVRNVLIKNPKIFNADFYNVIGFVKQGLVFSLIGAIVSNVLHFMYSIIFPSFYIGLNLIANLILFLLPLAIILLDRYSSFSIGIQYDPKYIYYLIGSVIVAFIGIYLFIKRLGLAKTSSAIMEASTKILLRHPSLFILEIVQSLLLLIVNGLYVYGLMILKYYWNSLNPSPLIIVYASFSYYWIIMTIYYVSYMTTSCVIGYEFYLGGHPSMPKFLVLFAFIRAVTYQFGCACYAGLILSLLHLLKSLIEYLNPNDKKKNENEVVTLLSDILYYVKKAIYYVLLFVVSIIEKIFKNITKHALIYCSIYGVSFSDACYRWQRKDFSQKIVKLQHSLMISGSLFTNYLIFSIVAVFISISLYAKYGENFDIKSNASYFTVGATLALMASFFYILNSLITTTSDTIYLCFLEQPHLLSRRFRKLCKEMEKII